MKWMWTHCRRRQEIVLLAARAINEQEKPALERHLAACEECRNYYSEIKALTAPLTGWEKNLSAIEATPAAQRRWAMAVQNSGKSGSVASLLQNLWGELLWPSRYAWSGMAAVWVAMLVINGQLSDHVASARPVSSQEIIQAWEEQTRVLAELIQPAHPAAAPPPFRRGPRSQAKQDSAII